MHIEYRTFSSVPCVVVHGCGRDFELLSEGHTKRMMVRSATPGIHSFAVCDVEINNFLNEKISDLG